MRTAAARTFATATKHGGSGAHSKRIIEKRLTPFWVKRARMEQQKAWAENPRPLAFSKGDDLPFAVHRTELGRNLPVYLDYKNGRTKVVTILRKCEGDVVALAGEMQKVCRETEVKIFNGRIEAKGNHTKAVNQWLAGLGF
jgi:large subunit ribosomal protein L49